jgi:hypothetical protein
MDGPIPVRSAPAFHHNSPTTTDPRPRATQWYADYASKDDAPLMDLRVSNVSSTIVSSAQSSYDHKPSSSLQGQCSLPNLTTTKPVNLSPLALFPRYPRWWRASFVPAPTLAFGDLTRFDIGLSLGPTPPHFFVCSDISILTNTHSRVGLLCPLQLTFSHCTRRPVYNLPAPTLARPPSSRTSDPPPRKDGESRIDIIRAKGGSHIRDRDV